MLLVRVGFLFLFASFVASNEQGCLNHFNPGIDYFPDKVSVKYSETFSISYQNSFKVINTFDGVNTGKYIAYQCGSTPPSETEYPGYKMISIPLNSVGISAETEIPFIDLLGKRRTITTYLEQENVITSPCFRAQIDESLTIPAFYLNTTLSECGSYQSTVANETVLKATNNELVFTDGYLSASDEIVQVAVYDWAEKTGLGAAELVKLYAAFYNVESEANRLFEDVSSQYDCISEKIQKTNELKSQKILWCYYFGEFSSDDADGWSCGTCPNYYCDFASALGSEILDQKNYHFTGFDGGLDHCTPLITDEEFLEMAKDADIFVYTGDEFQKSYNLKKSLLDQIPAVQNQKVFGTFGRGISPGNDWLESRLVQPDVVLQDLVLALSTGSKYAVNHDPVWILNVWESPNVFRNALSYTRGSCVDISVPMTLFSDSCDTLLVVPNPDSSSSGHSGLSNQQISAIVLSCLVLLILFIIALAVSIHALKRMKEEKIPFMRLSSVELHHEYV